MDWKKLMKMLSKTTICLIAFVFIFSTFITKFIDNLRTDSDFKQFQDNESLDRHKRFSQLKTNDLIRIDDKLRHTFWFIQVSTQLIPNSVLNSDICLQISDLHLSIHFDPKRGPDLEKFCTKHIDIIKPSVVLATGDLTDSRTRDPMGSTVFEKEWIMYWNVLNKTKVSSRTNWLDIKGNHGLHQMNALIVL